MEKKFPAHVQEIIIGSSDPQLSKQISKLEKSGRIKKIAPRLYTSNLTESPEAIVNRNLLLILGGLYPRALLSHRSAFEFKPTDTGNIFLTHKYTKKVTLVGVTIRFLKGHKPISGDNKISGELYVSQQARAFLENLQISRKSGEDSKTLPIPVLEEKLEQIIRVHGEAELNRLRDRAREIAAQLEMNNESERLNQIISALLSTKTANVLTSSVAAARAFGTPYDPARIELFESLFRELKSKEFKKRPDKNASAKAFKNFAFFESYFSNYIEGTEFAVDEARQIIETQKPLPARNADSHDVLGTYQIVSNRGEMKTTPPTAESLLLLLQTRHKILLRTRIEKNPGVFKDKNNFAGNTAFVDFNLVRGTFIRVFDLYQAIDSPFAKAIFMMFMVSEIHPFLDGNGRLARVMMNAELVSAGQSRIIIPTVYRDDYLGALRRLTRQRDPEPYIRMMIRAFEFSETIYGESIDEMQRHLESCDAFLEHTEGKLKIKNIA
jgi:Fic family protein